MTDVAQQQAEEVAVLLSVNGRVAVVTINRPERRNALDPPATERMNAIWDRIRDDDDIWVAVVTGRGEHAFSAGFDLKWSQEHPDANLAEVTHPNGFGGLTARRDLFKPVVAAVRGHALGGGFELMLSCDLVVAGVSSRFGFPEPRVGNAAMWGGIARLARNVPRNQASRVLLAGEDLDARGAADLGLIYQVVEDDRVLETAFEVAETICRSSPLAIQLTKALYLEALERPLSEAIAAGIGHPLAQRLQRSDDHREGGRAFAERREPQWTGR